MKKRYYLPVLSLVLFFAFLTQASAQYHYGKVTGMRTVPKLLASHSIKVAGNYAYVTGIESNALAILNVADPENPVHVANVDDGEGGAHLKTPIVVEVSGNYAYVVTESPNTVEVIDISNPASPIHISNTVHGAGGINLTGAADLVVTGNLGYLARQGSVEIIDFSNPLSPSSAGRFSDPGKQYNKGSVVGNYYYGTCEGTHVKVLDVSNPSAPTLACSYTYATNATNMSSYLRSITTSGNYAYATGDDYVEVIDIAVPTNIAYEGGYDVANSNYNTIISGNTAYLCGTQLIALDISNHASPTLLGSYNTSCLRSALTGNYVLTVSDKLEVIDVSSPTNMTSVNFFNPCAGLAISGNYAYVTKSYNALEIIEISNPAFPKTVGSILHGQGGASLDWPVSVAVSGNYAFITSANANMLEVIDVSNPAAPVHASSISDGTGGAKLKKPMSVRIKGNYAYIMSSESDALEIVDISNPAAPTHAASVSSGEQGSSFEKSEALSISGNLLYMVGSGANGITTFDISDPLNPIFVDSETSGGAISMAISGTNAYTHNLSLLNYVDVSNATPAFNGSVLIDDYSNGILLYSLRVAPDALFASGNYLFCASQGYDALSIFDMSDPYNPVLLKAITHDIGGALLDNPISVQAVGDYIYVASHMSNSLEVIYFNPNFPDEPTVTFSDIHKTYGDADFNLSATSGNSSGTITYGIVEGTGATVASNGATSLVAADTVQVYAQIATNGTYGPKAVSANLFIAPKGITVTVNAGQSKALAAADPTLTYTVNPSLVSGDAFSGALSRNSGETAGSYNITQGTLSAGSNYTITFSGNTFCINPDKPTITADGQDANILISSSSTGNQWYKDNSILNGATNNTYTVTSSGDYTVVNTVQGCSSVSSDAVTRIISGLENAMSENIALYPNPASNHLEVELSEASGSVQITIYDAAGRNAISTQSNLKRSTLNLDSLEPGVYWLRLQQEDKIVVKQFVKN